MSAGARAPRRAAAPILMALSGASALAYETVWMRMLGRAFGVTVYAIAGLVALYMAGLAIGAALAERRRGVVDWLRAYARLELAAGVCALAATAWLVRLPSLIASWSGDAPLPEWARLALAAPALLPPTILLGATLPVLARDGGDAATLYGANTLGAVAGLCAAAFVSIGTWGETATVEWACGANLAAAAAAFLLSRRASAREAGAPAGARGGGAAVSFFVISGFCALGCEVLWSRQLVPLLGTSTYAFALILAFYLAGLGLGSCLRLESRLSPWSSFAALLGALGASISLSAATTRFIGLQLDSADFIYSPLRTIGDFPLVAFQAAVLVFPTALVLGLLFPAALRLGGGQASVGRLYAWNTVGGIAGALFCGFAGVAVMGSHAALLALAGLACAAALGAAAVSRDKKARLPCAACAALALAFGVYARRDPSLEILLNRVARLGSRDLRVLFQDESPAASTIGLEHGGRQSLFINGIEVSGKDVGGDFMAILADLALAHPRRTLVICFGAGNTFRAASILGGQVDAVELVGDVPKHMISFHPDAEAHLRKKGNRVFAEDGRQFLLRSRSSYDAVIVDAAPPLYSAGAVNLYTREFFELVRARLDPGGVFLLWLPTLSFESDYWRILRSFCDVFAHASVWQMPGWSGFMILGSQTPLEWPRGELDRRIAERVRGKFTWKHLDEEHIRGGFWLPEADLRAFLARFEPVTDDRPAVEFPLARFWRREPLMRDTEFLRRARRAAKIARAAGRRGA